MRVYVMRHGPAEEGGADHARRLSEDGRAKTRDAARGLAALDAAEEIDAIVTSPLARARETAEIVARELDLEPKLALAEALAPGARGAAIWKEVHRHAKRGALVVGHEPDMGDFVRYLLGGAESFDAPLKKAGVACVDVEPAAVPGAPRTLVFFATPAMLRALGAAGS
jgi:phosphohistidine phosphatase